MRKWGVLALLCSLLSACGTTESNGAPTSPAAESEPAFSHAIPSPEPADSVPSRTAIAIRSPMTLSNNLVPGMARKDMYLRIQLVQGTYSEDWAPGAYQGTLYEGRFEGVIADSSGQTLSATRLDSLFPEPLIFTRHFSLAIDDYNGDGYPDFTLGQRAGSNGGEYKILTVADDLIIRELPVRGLKTLYISKGEEGGGSYSVKLRKSKNGLVSFSFYSQEQGKYLERSLKWQDGEFIPYTG